MNIKNIGAKMKSMTGEVKAKKEPENMNENKTQKEPQINNQQKNKGHKLEGLAHAAKAIPLNIKKKKELSQIAHKEAFRKESLVAEARSNGVNKKEAKNGAEALMGATGVHTHKSAEDSAKVFESEGKSAAEYAADAAERKEILKQKFNK